MTRERPQAERAAALLAVLENAPCGAWLSRNDLASKTGKRRLSPNDITHLDALARAGWLESEKRETRFKGEWFYRFIQE